MVVSEDYLQEARDHLSVLSSCHVYSVHRVRLKVSG